jgi:hypothetical protein
MSGIHAMSASNDIATPSPDTGNPRPEITIRPVHERDWPEILDLANRSAIGTPNEGPQDQWLENRRQFDEKNCLREHFVAVDGTGAIVGYVAAECLIVRDMDFRVHLVTPRASLETVGSALYDATVAALAKYRNVEIRFNERIEDEALVGFALARGFVEVKQYPLADGARAIRLKKDLPPSAG